MGLEDWDKLPADLQQKLIQIDANKPANRQLDILKDIADISQELLGVVDTIKEGGVSNHAQTGAVLLDIRESLTNLVDKEDPDIEIPDYAQPVVDAVAKLDKSLTAALKKIDVKPQVKVDAPEVHVDSPPVNVDLKGIERILKTDMPKAFDKAISAIEIPEVPHTDFSPVVDKLNELSEKLDSIDHASRMKPQFPSQLAVTNPDGSTISGGGGGGGGAAKTTDAYGIQAISDTGTYKYFFFEDASGNWYVMRKNLSTSVFDYTKGTGGYITVYVNSTSAPSGSPTYASYGVTF